MKFSELGRALVAFPTIALTLLEEQLEESERKRNQSALLIMRPMVDEMLYDIVKRRHQAIKIEEPQIISDIIPIEGLSFIVKDNVALFRYKLDKASLSSEIDLESLKELLGNDILKYIRDNGLSNLNNTNIHYLKNFRSYIEVVVSYQVV